jgi:hypothetical protein
MKWLDIAGHNCPMGKDQPEYATVNVRRGTTYVQHGSLLVPCPNIVAEIQLEPDEIAHVVAGGSLFYEVLGQSWPPVAIGISDPALRNPEGNA